VQADPIKPTLEPPVTKRLKQKHDEALSSFAFKFNLRRYTKGLTPEEEEEKRRKDRAKVGQCRLTL